MEVSRKRSKSDVAKELGVTEQQLFELMPKAGIDPDERADGTLNQIEFEALLNTVKPFRIVPTIQRDETFTAAEARDMLKSKGAITTPKGLLLQFRTLDEAASVMAEIVAKSSESYWAIVKL